MNQEEVSRFDCSPDEEYEDFERDEDKDHSKYCKLHNNDHKMYLMYLRLIRYPRTYVCSSMLKKKN